MLNGDVSDSVRVLVVDDSEFFGTLVAGELSKQYDMETERTDSADEALASLERHDVDCVVSDYDMPETDGIELFHRTRAHGIDVPFFLLTAAGSEAVASEAITAGIDDYFPKTRGEKQFEILGQRITNVVEQRRTENRLQRQRQLHGKLWSITQELISASSRTEIATTVCEGLVTADRFEFAWLQAGTRGDPTEPEPVAAAGLDADSLAAVRDELAGLDESPIEASLEERTVQTTQLDGPQPVTLAVLPLIHQDRSYGVLAVGSRPQPALRESGTETLAHLGTTVGHALASVEMQREVEIFQEAVDQADTAILITDRNGVIEYANSACSDITGYGIEEIVGEPVEILATDSWGREFYESVWERVRRGEAVREELVQRKADGAQFYVDLSAAPVRLDGRVEKFILVESDITVLKSNEQRLEVLNRVLRHNLRNDLNVIKGNLSLVLETLDDDDDHSRLELAQRKVEELLTLGEKAQFVNKTVGAADGREEHTLAAPLRSRRLTSRGASSGLRCRSSSRRTGSGVDRDVDSVADGQREITADEFDAEPVASTEKCDPRYHTTVRRDGTLVPGDGSTGNSAHTPAADDRATPAGQETATGVVREAAVEDATVAGQAGEDGPGIGVAGFVEHRPRLPCLGHGSGAVPGYRHQGDVDRHRERSGRPVRICPGGPEAEVDVVRDPRGEETGTDEPSERVADLDRRPGFDPRFHVEQAGDVAARIDQDEVVVVGRVWFLWGPDCPCVDDLASHWGGRRRCLGVEIDRTALVVGRERRVVKRKAVVLAEHVPTDRDRHRSHVGRQHQRAVGRGGSEQLPAGDGNRADLEIECDGVGLAVCEVVADHRRSAERRVAGEGDLRRRCEDPDRPRTFLRVAGDKRGLRVVDLGCDRLHLADGQIGRVGDDTELVAGVLPAGEDVDETEASGHGSSVGGETVKCTEGV